MACVNLSHTQLLIVVGFVLHLYNNFAYRFLDSFVPRYLKHEHLLSEIEIGLVFSSFCVSVFALSPLWGIFCNRHGPKAIVVLGLALEGLVLLALSVSGWVSDRSTFIVMMVVLRGVEGVGSAATQTGCYAMLAAASGSSGEHAGGGMGGMEMFGGIGNMLGPLVGAAIFSRYGYSWPFVATGVLGLAAAAAATMVLPSKQKIIDAWDAEFIVTNTDTASVTDNTSAPTPPLSSRAAMSASVRAYIGQKSDIEAPRQSQSVSLKQVLAVPSVVYSCCVPIVALSAVSFLSAQLELAFHSQHGLNDLEISACFVLLSFIQLITCPLAGYASDRTATKLPMLSGLCLMTAALLMLGPTSFIPNAKPDLVIQLPALSLLGAGVSLAVIPTFADQIKATQFLGPQAQPIVAGLSSSMFSLGEVMGPIVGSILTQYFTFNTACTVFAIVCLSVGTGGLMLVHCRVIPWDFIVTNTGTNAGTRTINVANTNAKGKAKGVVQMIRSVRIKHKGYEHAGSPLPVFDLDEDDTADGVSVSIKDDDVYEMDTIDAKPVSQPSLLHSVAVPVNGNGTVRKIPIASPVPVVPMYETDDVHDDDDDDVDVITVAPISTNSNTNANTSGVRTITINRDYGSPLEPSLEEDGELFDDSGKHDDDEADKFG